MAKKTVPKQAAPVPKPRSKTARAKRRELQNGCYSLAVQAEQSGDFEAFTKLATLFERQFQNDLKLKPGRNGPKRTDLAAKREELLNRLRLVRGEPEDQ